MRSKLVPSSPVLLVVLALLLLACPLHAQKGSGGGSSRGNSGSSSKGSGSATSFPYNSSPVYPGPSDSEFDTPYVTGPSQLRLKSEEPLCFRWPMSPLLSAAVSVNQMKVPAPAQAEFVKACAAVRRKDWPEAEQHSNRAINLYPKFAAAWVLLGQTQQDQQKADQAARSCTQARDADATYLPSYLCLADLAARQAKWAEVADLTNQVLASHPVRAPGAYYYNSLAYFYLKQGALAEQSALRAIEDGGREQKPQVYWLLAKIYEEKGDRASEAAQLRQYLKLAPHAPDASIARDILEEIKRQTTDAASTTGKPAENK